MSTRAFLAFALLLAFSVPRFAFAADSVETPPPVATWKADPLFPGAGHGSIGVGSGIPFLAMGEAAYAPTNHFAIGAIVGVTPFVFGAGIRPRVGVPLGDRTRVSLVAPILWYPTGDGLFGNGAPWFLAQPSLRLERKIGERFYANAGGRRDRCHRISFTRREWANDRDVQRSTRRRNRNPMGNWNTFGVGVAASLFDRTSVFADGIVIMRGVELAGADWIGGPPFAFTLGVTRTL